MPGRRDSSTAFNFSAKLQRLRCSGRREMKRNNGSKKNRTKGILLMVAGLFLVNPSSIWAQQVTEDALVNQLMTKLQERDQVIADLQRRVQQLEHRVGGVPQVSESTKAAQPPASPPTRSGCRPTPAAPPTKAVADQPVQQTAANEAATKTPPNAVAKAKPAPGLLR